MSNTVRIYDDIPLPEGGRGNWPFKTLKVGQCFQVPDDKQATVRAMASRIGAQIGRQFTIRTIHSKKNGKPEIFCWRVK